MPKTRSRWPDRDYTAFSSTVIPSGSLNRRTSGSSSEGSDLRAQLREPIAYGRAIERRDLDAEVRDARLVAELIFRLFEPEPRIADREPDAPGLAVLHVFLAVEHAIELQCLAHIGHFQQRVIHALGREQALVPFHEIRWNSRGDERVGRRQELELDAVGVGENACDATAAD